ncbi:MAG: nitroreductase family protein [Deltaproteobacteria bacterium]|nr:nitroreductase family protein [Deltaproteobacteria bacterium]
MEFNTVLRLRRSVRKFQERQVEQAVLNEILKAGQSAPIGSNLYRDLHLTILKDRLIMKSLYAAQEKQLQDTVFADKVVKEVLNSGNDPPTRVPFYGAPVVIDVSHRLQELQPGIEIANVTSVVQTMHLAATNLGLGSVYVWGIFESMRMHPELDQTSLLNLPENFRPLMGLMLGYPAKPLIERDIKVNRIRVNIV